MAEETLFPIFTIGHSNRSEAEFLELLAIHKIEVVVDVRSTSRSRTHPQFQGAVLKRQLSACDIGYLHFPELGGRRRPAPRTKNDAWKRRSLRGYADHMASDVFEIGIHELMTIAHQKRVALMCAESLPWHCHRSLLADSLVVRGFEVIHIVSREEQSVHELPAFAKVRGKKVMYPRHGEADAR